MPSHVGVGVREHAYRCVWLLPLLRVASSLYWTSSRYGWIPQHHGCLDHIAGSPTGSAPLVARATAGSALTDEHTVAYLPLVARLLQLPQDSCRCLGLLLRFAAACRYEPRIADAQQPLYRYLDHTRIGSHTRFGSLRSPRFASAR